MDLDKQIEQLKRCEYIKEAEVKELCEKAKTILIEEANVQRVEAPVTVRKLNHRYMWSYMVNLRTLWNYSR
jgi:hypothetical protein